MMLVGPNVSSVSGVSIAYSEVENAREESTPPDAVRLTVIAAEFSSISEVPISPGP